MGMNSSPRAGRGVRLRATSAQGLKLRAVTSVGAAICGLLAPATAFAQYGQDDSTLIRPAIPEGFDRGRNVSVTERARPDYDPLGLLVSSFKVLPRLGLGVGATDNVFLNAAKEGDGFAYISPAITATSDWSRHQVRLRASSNMRRFFDNARRNETAYDFGGLGRLDATSALSFTGEAQLARLYENPDSGTVAPSLAVLSRFQRSFLSARGEYRAGRGRAILAFDRSHFEFNNIRLVDGSFIDQSDRDRTINRGTAQLEYAVTPSASFYVQGSYFETNYDRNLLNGSPNRDSNSYRFIGGFSFDMSSLFRGRMGLGYTRRDFRWGGFKDVGGVSIESQLEYFPTDLTTFTFSAARTLEDGNINANSAFFNTQVSLRADHELLRNLLLNGQATYASQKYVDTGTSASSYGFAGGARYLSSRYLALDLGLSYSRRKGTVTSLPYSEFRGQIGIVLTR